MVAAIAVEVFMIVFYQERKVYDLSTAVFFAYGLGWIARRKYALYFLAFPLACINRETTFLLTIIFAVYGCWRIDWKTWIFGLGYQGVVFGVVRLFLVTHFADLPGGDFLFRPLENLYQFLMVPLLTATHLCVFIAVTWLCLRNWKMKPSLLRTSFLILATSITMLYLVFGWAFEVRVFAEVFPIAWALCWWKP